jgi:hypothetical protein
MSCAATQKPGEQKVVSSPRIYQVCKGPDYRTSPVESNASKCIQADQSSTNIDCEEGSRVLAPKGHPCFGLLPSSGGFYICALERQAVEGRCAEGLPGYVYIYTDKSLSELVNDAMTIHGVQRTDY